MKIPENAAEIWDFIYPLIDNPYGVAAVLGNLYAESGMKPNNLQNSYSRSLSMSDEEYTRQVDNREYFDFATDGAGYGIAQWTYKARKQNMLATAQVYGKSIGDLTFQLYFLCAELRNYSVVLDILRTCTSIREASDAFITMYEKPANITQEKKEIRANYAEQFYEAFKDLGPEKFDYMDLPETARTLKRGCKGDDVFNLQKDLLYLGYDLGPKGADGSYGKSTAAAVKLFQTYYGLYADGIAGALTQDILFHVSIQKDHEIDDAKTEEANLDYAVDPEKFLIKDTEEPETKETSVKYKITVTNLDEPIAQALFTLLEQYPVTLEIA